MYILIPHTKSLKKCLKDISLKYAPRLRYGHQDGPLVRPPRGPPRTLKGGQMGPPTGPCYLVGVLGLEMVPLAWKWSRMGVLQKTGAKILFYLLQNDNFYAGCQTPSSNACSLKPADLGTKFPKPWGSNILNWLLNYQNFRGPKCSSHLVEHFGPSKIW